MGEPRRRDVGRAGAPRRRGYAGDMSNDARTPGSDDGRDPLEEMLRQLFGGQGPDPDEVRRAVEGRGGPGGGPSTRPS